MKKRNRIAGANLLNRASVNTVMNAEKMEIHSFLLTMRHRIVKVASIATVVVERVFERDKTFMKNIMETLFGSKYNKKLPYTYEAVSVIVPDDNDPVLRHWHSDTICGLCSHLKSINEDPAEIIIYEVFDNKETIIPANVFMENGDWLSKEELCNAHIRYGSVGNEFNCGFKDRNPRVIG